MAKKISSHLSASDKDFLRAINFEPPPVKITPAGPGPSLYDELMYIMLYRPSGKTKRRQDPAGDPGDDNK